MSNYGAPEEMARALHHISAKSVLIRQANNLFYEIQYGIEN